MSKAINLVVTQRRNCDYYMGRPTTLGNPFPMKSEADRDKVCEQFEEWFRKKLKDEDSAVMAELNHLMFLAMGEAEFKIGCYCAPRRCHLDTIARYFNNYGFKNE